MSQIFTKENINNDEIFEKIVDDYYLEQKKYSIVFNNKYYSVLLNLLSLNLKLLQKEGILNLLTRKFLSKIDFNEEEEDYSNLINVLIFTEHFFDQETIKIIYDLYKNPSLYIYNNHFKTSTMSIYYLKKISNPTMFYKEELLFKYCFNFLSTDLISLFYNIENKDILAIKNNTLFEIEKGISLNNMLDSYYYKNQSELFKDCFFQKLFTDNILFYDLISELTPEKEEEFINRVVFLKDNNVINLQDIFVEWSNYQNNYNLHNDANTFIERQKKHPFLKIVKSNFHKIALFFLEEGYKISEEENKYIEKIKKSNLKLYLNFIHKKDKDNFDIFKEYLGTNKNKMLKAEKLLKENKSEFFEKLINEDSKSKK